MNPEPERIGPMGWSGLVLATATVVVALGTAVVDPSRLWLLLVPTSFLVTAYAAGTLADRGVGRMPPLPDRFPALDLATRVIVGIACLSLVAVSSAMMGLLWVGGIIVLPVLVFGLFLLVRAGSSVRFGERALLALPAGLILGGTWLLAWLWATIPPTFYDELVYHFVIPERALATGELLTAPWVFFTLMPHASDLLLAWGMAFGGDLGARATAFALWVSCTLAAWGLAEAIAKPEPTPATPILVAGALATSPTLWFLGTLPFAEACLAATVVSAALLLAASPAEPRPWLSLGLVLGLAATVKLSGLYWVLAVLAATAVVGWSWRDIAGSALVVLVSVAPWWIRAFAHTGNPIYPMAYDLLGGSPWSRESQAKLMGDLPYGTGGFGLLDLVRLPLDLVQHPERFGSASDAGVPAIVSVCGLLALPVIVRAAGAGSRVRRLSEAAAILVLIAGACWVGTSPTTRFFAPALVIGLMVGVGAALRLGSAGRMVAMVVALGLGAVGTTRFIEQHARVFSASEVALGRESTDRYLSREVDHFEAARFVRAQVPVTAQLLFIGESRPYYFARAAIAPYPFDRHPLEQWVREASSPDALAARLAAEGITHVVLNVREFKRLHDSYGVLAFSGEGAQVYNRRLKDLPRALRLLFEKNGVFVFEVPHN